jgi:L-alanine-DL-glutamate epimerase-like enolase superfamily enzyme
MDCGIGLLRDVPGAISAPLGFTNPMNQLSRAEVEAMPTEERRALRRKWYDYFNIAHPFTGIQVTEAGLAYLDEYVGEVRSVLGYKVPISTDHYGHIGVENCIKIAQRLDKYNLAWYEDMVPWQYTDQYVRLSNATTTPVCTGEDIYLKENFRPLLEARGVSIIHPDLLSVGGIYELKKVGDLAQDNAVSMAIHMAESPVACMAAAHAAVATENFLALEFHSNDVDWWDDIVLGTDKPLIKNGWLTVTDKPGLGIDDYNDEVIKEHLDPNEPGLWEPTDQWNDNYSNDRLWS